MQATFQTRLQLGFQDGHLLDAWGALYARVEHELFAAFAKTGDVKVLEKSKASVCAKHRITARHYNAVAVTLKGKIASRQAVDKLTLVETKLALASVQKTLTTLRRLKKRKRSLDFTHPT